MEEGRSPLRGGPPIKTFQAYQIVRKLGPAGALATAFEARQAGLDRSVELRILNRRVDQDAPSYHRFEREFRILAALDHPALIKVLDLGVADGRVFYTTDFRDAESLRELVHAAPEGLDLDQVLGWLLPVGEALALLHQAGVLHRDLGLDSVKVDRQTGRAYLASFSLVKVMRLPSLTERGNPLPEGRAVASPEAVAGENADERTDVFLFGSLLYQALTGRRLPTLREALGSGATCGEDLAPPSEAQRGLPEFFDEPILEAMARDPEARPPNMKELLRRLRAGQDRWKAQSAALAVGYSKTALSRAELTRLAEEEAAQAAREAREARAAGELPPEEPPEELTSSAVGEAVLAAREWLNESPTRKKGAGLALLVCGGLAGGLVWLTLPQPPPPGAPLRKRVVRAKRTTDPEAVKKTLLAAAEAAASEPTKPRTFEARWKVLRSYVLGLPAETRLKAFPPSAMAELRIAYFRDPQQASKRLDEALAKAAGMAGK